MYILFRLERGPGIALQAMQEKKALSSRLVLSDSVRPHRWKPTRPCRPWDSPGKNTEVPKTSKEK